MTCGCKNDPKPCVPKCRENIKDICRIKPCPPCDCECCPPTPCVRRKKCAFASIKDKLRHPQPCCPKPCCPKPCPKPCPKSRCPKPEPEPEPVPFDSDSDSDFDFDF